jgi:predicted translin family RNA/ssDNA-binding protein
MAPATSQDAGEQTSLLDAEMNTKMQQLSTEFAEVETEMQQASLTSEMQQFTDAKPLLTAADFHSSERRCSNPAFQEEVNPLAQEMQDRLDNMQRDILDQVHGMEQLARLDELEDVEGRLRTKVDARRKDIEGVHARLKLTKVQKFKHSRTRRCWHKRRVL